MKFLKYKIKKKSNLPHFLCVNVPLRLGGAPSQGTLKDMLGKSPFSMRAPFHLRGTWYVGGLVYWGL